MTIPRTVVVGADAPADAHHLAHPARNTPHRCPIPVAHPPPSRPAHPLPMHVHCVARRDHWLVTLVRCSPWLLLAGMDSLLQRGAGVQRMWHWNVLRCVCLQVWWWRTPSVSRWRGRWGLDWWSWWCCSTRRMSQQVARWGRYQRVPVRCADVYGIL